jgi:EAL domain-containing protein (putative c-di-GMP-specific phosphodiesterase class I)
MIWEILFWNRLCGTVKAFYSRSLPVSVINERMAVLRGYGIKFAMDDFGTGSSSSAMALEMLIDEIKIDMSFIRKILVNKKNKAIVQSMVDFANAANIKSCLEGVALEDYLRTVGATWFQGYYYSRPVGADKLEILLSNSWKK